MLNAGPKTGYDGTLPTIESDVEWFEAVTRTTLYGWQRRELAGLLASDRPPVYYLQVPRKNGKSYLAAAAALCEARRPGRHIYVVSDSERNLQSALFREIRDIVAASPILAATFIPFQSKFEVPSTGSFIEARPNKFAASQSINPHMVIMDECHLQKTDDIWHGYRMACSARSDGILLGITTPGQDVSAPAHDWYEAVRAGQIPGRVYEPSNADEAMDDHLQWAEANPRLEDDPAFLSRLIADRADLPEHQFRRYRLGMWTAGDTSWFKHGVWQARTVRRELEPGEKIWVGFDGSYSGDSTALVACTSDGYIQVLKVWENPGSKSWRVPRDEVHDAVDAVMGYYDVEEMLCDPPYWQEPIAEWGRKYPGKIVEFPTYVRARMVPACTAFTAAVLEERLTHNGDARLARHVANCVVRPSPMGDYVTKAAQDSPAKIDLAIAGIVAYSRAVSYTAPVPRPRVFVI